MDPHALGGSPTKEELEVRKIEAINEGKKLDLQIHTMQMMKEMMPLMNNLVDFRRERDGEREREMERRVMRRRFESTDWVEKDMEAEY
jgi:aspartyl-tRNA synthetase